MPRNGIVAVVLERTRQLWNKQHRSVGDRSGLFEAVAGELDGSTVLYPGSYVDIEPSFVWPSVTYIDVDRRSRQFFADIAGIDVLLAEHGRGPDLPNVVFIHADYSGELGLEDHSFDLLISLYAGFVSEHCTRYLRPGGLLLVAPSHGDAAMASIDPRYRLHGVVEWESGGCRIEKDGLETHLRPKRDVAITVEFLHDSGRGVEYTKSLFAYLFERIA